MDKAVVLLSGGLDSATCMAVAHSKGYDLYPISFNYHQRHSIELESAKKIAKFYQVRKQSDIYVFVMTDLVISAELKDNNGF